MRSPQEIRAEIERLRKKPLNGQPYDIWKAVYMSALEWVLAYEQPKETTQSLSWLEQIQALQDRVEKLENAARNPPRSAYVTERP